MTTARKEPCCIGWLIATAVTAILFGGLAFLGWLSHWVAQ